MDRNVFKSELQIKTMEWLFLTYVGEICEYFLDFFSAYDQEI